MADIPIKQTLSFWHQRLAEAMSLLGLAIVLIYLLGQVSQTNAFFNLSSSLAVNTPAAVLAAVIVMLSLIGYFNSSKKASFWILFTSYALLISNVFILIDGSGGLDSPYLSLLVLITVLAGLFKNYGLGLATLAINGYLVFQVLTNPSLSLSGLITFVISLELTLVFSYALWRYQPGESGADGTYSALIRELGQVANKSEIVINAIADGVVAIDQKGVIQLLNPSAQTLLGWGKQDASGLDYRSVIKIIDQSNDTVDPNLDPIAISLNTGQAVTNNDLSIVMPSGKSFAASIRVSTVGKAEAKNGVIVVFRDITNSKSQQREQAEFISTASHEMRTPVAAIDGYLGLVLNPQTAQIDDKAREYIQKAQDSTKHLGRLFQDLLDISRLEDGRLKANTVLIDTVSFAGRVTDNFQSQASQKGLALKFIPKQSSGPIGRGSRLTPIFYTKADVDQLEEALSNLIENALKYTKKGEVKVDVKGDEEVVNISVQDSGLGIPAEDLPHLFQKFYRVDSTDTREIGGTGLGLYLTRRLIESFDGNLTADSKYGEGSTFTIELRRVNEEEANAAVNSIEEG